MSTWAEFFGGDEYQNRRLRDHAQELATLNSIARRNDRQLRSQLAAVKGDLDSRVDRLSRSFDAFVELSDLRVTLGAFGDEATLRHRTGTLLAGLLAGGSAAVSAPKATAETADPVAFAAQRLIELDHVPGYWLSPAARALALMIDDGSTADPDRIEELVASATDLDPERTNAFLTVSELATGRATTTERLDELLAGLTPGRPATRLSQALYRASIAGRLGPDAVRAAEAHIVTVVDSLDAEAAAAEQTRWSNLFDELGEHGRTTTLAAGSRLAGAAALVETGRVPTEADPEPIPAAIDLTRTDRQPIGADTVGAEVDPLDAGADPVDAELLGSLIDLLSEGSPEEVPLLRRADELRQIIEDGAAEPRVRWNDPTGDILELIRADALHAGPAGPPARRAGRSWIGTWADAQMETLTGATAPRKKVKPFSGVPAVTVTPAGPDEAEREEAENVLDERASAPDDGRSGYWAMVIGAIVALIAVVVAIAGATVAWLVAVAAVVAAGLGALAQTQTRGDTAAAAHRAETRRRQLGNAIERARQEMEREAAELDGWRASATHHRETIRRLTARSSTSESQPAGSAPA